MEESEHTEESEHEIVALSKKDAQVTYSASLRPEAKALRDGYLQSFSQQYKIGKLFSNAGGVLFEGKTATEWMQNFRILPGDKSRLTVEELKAYFMKLAQAYHTASSFHANLYIASEKLLSVIEEKEAQFITEEVAKYKKGGVFWDETSNKLKAGEKRPAKEQLEKMAQHYTLELRRAYQDLKMEVSFFQHILADLEAQRRCLKDYSEITLQEARTTNIL
jgi:hypothetical protein